MNVLQALSPEKRFLSPRRGLNPQFSGDRWDAPTIELWRLRWWTEVQVWHMCDLSRSHYMLIMIMMRYIFELWELRYTLNERWTLVKLYPQKNDFWAPDEDRAWRAFISHSKLNSILSRPEYFIFLKIRLHQSVHIYCRLFWSFRKF